MVHHQCFADQLSAAALDALAAQCYLRASSPLFRQLAPCSSPQLCLQASHFNSGQRLNLTPLFFPPFPDEGVHGRVSKSGSSLRWFAPVVLRCRLCNPPQRGAVSFNICLFGFCCIGRCAGLSKVYNLDCLLSQQQSCLLISHVIEALVLDPQAARWAPWN